MLKFDHSTTQEIIQSSLTKKKKIIQSSRGPRHLFTNLLKDSHLFKIA